MNDELTMSLMNLGHHGNKVEEEILAEISRTFPQLATLAQKAPFAVDHISEILRKADIPIPVDVNALRNILENGYYPKSIFQFLYEHFVDGKLEEDLLELKEARQVFLVTDQDKMRKLFLRLQCWYFIPVLAHLHAFNEVGSLNRPMPASFIVIYVLTNDFKHLMPWLITLLFDFCTPHTITIGKTESQGSVGKLFVRISVDEEGSNCKISLHADDKKSCDRALMLMEVVKETINECPVLSRCLELKKFQEDIGHGLHDQSTENLYV